LFNLRETSARKGEGEGVKWGGQSRRSETEKAEGTPMGDYSLKTSMLFPSSRLACKKKKKKIGEEGALENGRKITSWDV